MSELKSCPFCACPGVLENKPGYTPEEYRVFCSNCKSSIYWHDGKLAGGLFDSDYCPSKARIDAIEAWNNRSSEALVDSVEHQTGEIIGPDLRAIDFNGEPLQCLYCSELSELLDHTVDHTVMVFFVKTESDRKSKIKVAVCSNGHIFCVWTKDHVLKRELRKDQDEIS